MNRPEVGVYAKGFDRHDEFRQGRVIGHSMIDHRVFFIKGFGGQRVYRMMSGKALAVQPMPIVHEDFIPECSADQDAIAILNRKRLGLI